MALLASAAAAVEPVVELSGGDAEFYRNATKAQPGHVRYALLATGNVRGWYAPCGCVSGQAGGLGRRVALDQLVTQATPDVPRVWVDVGSAVTPEIGEIASLKSRAIFASMGELGVVAANVAHAETTAGLDVVTGWAGEFGVPQVSASLVFAEGGKADPGARANGPWPASLLVELGGVRVAFIGVMAHSEERSFEFGGREVRTRSVREALAAGLEAAKGQGAEHVVLLAALTIDEVETALAEQGGVDLVFGASAATLHQRRSAGTELSWVGARGRFVVEVSVGSAGPFPVRAAEEGLPVQVRYHHLKDNYPSHPAGQAHEESTRRAINALGELRAEAAVAGRSRQARVFAGVTACRSCHIQEYLTWEKTGHARAMDALVTAGAEYNPECTICHSTGPELSGGFRSLLETPELAGVQCEACHGAGLEHATMRVKMTQRQPPAPALCRRCHDEDNSPSFDHALYWPKIAHGGR